MPASNAKMSAKNTQINMKLAKPAVRVVIPALRNVKKSQLSFLRTN